MAATSAEGAGQPAQPARPTRLILYVGKGGVGKTTMAAATAVRAAEMGHRTLVVSTDIAHSLGDVLDMPLGAEPQEVADRLDAQEINVLDEVRRTWGRFQDKLADFLRREGISDVQADELAIIPGMEEVAALAQIGRKSRTGEYDCIVVDAAPTGETIRLLSMPESYQWYAGRIDAWRGRILRLVGPFLRGMIPNLDVVDVMNHMAMRVRELRAVLADAQRSSYRIVVTPDRMVLKEAQRAETYLNLFEYPIDAVIANRVLAPDTPDAGVGAGFARPLGEPGAATAPLHAEPPLATTGRRPATPTTAGSASDRLLDALVTRQQAMMAEIRASFPTLPLFQAPLLAQEPIGVAALTTVGRQVFGTQDPTAVLHVGPTLEVKKHGQGYLLRIPMPNVEVDRLSLTKHADELYVDVGNFRRRIALPLALAGLEPGAARVHAGTLEIPFSGQAAPNGGASG